MSGQVTAPFSCRTDRAALRGARRDLAAADHVGRVSMLSLCTRQPGSAVQRKCPTLGLNTPPRGHSHTRTPYSCMYHLRLCCTLRVTAVQLYSQVSRAYSYIIRAHVYSYSNGISCYSTLMESIEASNPDRTQTSDFGRRIGESGSDSAVPDTAKVGSRGRESGGGERYTLMSSF